MRMVGYIDPVGTWFQSRIMLRNTSSAPMSPGPVVAATMTRVAYPEMRAQGYDPRLAAGSLAAGGTLGIMIPPSIALLLYARSQARGEARR